MSGKEKGRGGGIGRGILASVVSALGMIVVPMVLVTYLPEVADVSVDLSAVTELLNRWMMAGAVLVVLAFPTGYFPKGSRGRIASVVLQFVAWLAWFAYVLNMGDLTGIVTIVSDGSEVSVDIVLKGIMLMWVVSRALKVLVAFGDHHDNRRGFLEERGPAEEEQRDDIRIGGRFD